MTNTTNTPGLRAALIEARDWFESQAKAVSKGCGSSYELHDLREQRDALDAALAAPAQPVAHVSQETFNDDGTSDIIIPALPIGMALYAAPQPAAQALDSVRVFWQQHTQADALSMTMAELHDDVELVIRAARVAAQAAPVVADVQDEECDVPPFGWRCTREKDHDGPCAAVESQEDKDFVERGMRRIRDAADAARWHWLGVYLIGSRLDMDDEIVACESLGQLAVLVDTAIATDGAAQQGGTA